MGAQVRGGVALFYALALALFAGAFWITRPDWIALIALVPFALHLFWQIATLNPVDAHDPLAKFRSNRTTGLLMALACAAVGTAH